MDYALGLFGRVHLNGTELAPQRQLVHAIRVRLLFHLLLHLGILVVIVLKCADSGVESGEVVFS